MNVRITKNAALYLDNIVLFFTAFLCHYARNETFIARVFLPEITKGTSEVTQTTQFILNGLVKLEDYIKNEFIKEERAIEEGMQCNFSFCLSLKIWCFTF